MAIATIQFTGGQLRLDCAGGDVRGSRKVKKTDPSRFEGWAKRYEQALGRPKAGEVLLEIGREIYKWLDGNQRWLEKLRASDPSELVLEFTTKSRPDEADQTFLEVPWELLADKQGHLAARQEPLYCPVRRLGQRRSSKAKLSRHRLSVLFMAADPEDLPENRRLHYEDEETAILGATRDAGLDLVVEESGTLELLAVTLAGESAKTPMNVLHISCHGTRTKDKKPALLLEDETGLSALATAAKFSRKITEGRPGLLFLSACKSASGEGVVDPLAASSVSKGFPAVLGWSGSVRDGEATTFAAELYRRLAMGADLAEAVARARLDLLAPEGEALREPSKDWHLARLYLAASGGGALCCAGGKARRRHRPGQAQQAFLNSEDRKVPVAAADEFVGRRRQMQKILRTFRQPQGVLLHGLGRQGKSSLAARVAQRLSDHKLLVLHGDYRAADILDAFVSSAQSTKVTKMIEEGRELLERHPRAFSAVLRELLEGPCRERAGGAVLLVVDDFEQVLDEPGEGGEHHRLKPDFVDPIGAVIQAFTDADSDSRLLFTSRYGFALSDGRHDLAGTLAWVNLPSMHEYESQKQAAARLRVTGQKVTRRRAERAIKLAHGNPGLQDLLFRLAAEDGKVCDRMLDEMDAFLGSGDAPEEEKLLEFLENLALDRLIGLLDEGESELLRAMTLFSLPTPLPILAQVAEHFALGDSGPMLDRLVSLGLCERQQDLARPKEEAVAVSALARPKAGELSEKERTLLAKRITAPLFELWGGADGSKGRPYPADFELAQLALLASETAVLLATAEDAVIWLSRRFQYRPGAAIGRDAVTAFDKAEQEVPLQLLRRVGELCKRVGDTPHARDLFTRAVAHIEAGLKAGKAGEPEDHASVLVSQARLLVQDGRPDDALAALQRAGGLLSDDRFASERAVTLGDIARIMTDKGQVDQALALHEERLSVFDELGDVSEAAHTNWMIGQIEMQRGNAQAAADHLTESYGVLLKLGRLDGICTVGVDLGHLLCSAGQKEKGLPILERSRDGFRQLGREDYAKEVQGLIDQISGEDG